MSQIKIWKVIFERWKSVLPRDGYPYHFLIILILFQIHLGNLHSQYQFSDPITQDFRKFNHSKNQFLSEQRDFHQTKQTNTDSIFTTLGMYGWGFSLAVDVKDSFVYIGNGAIFQVINISNPANPIITGEALLDDLIYDIKIKDGHALVCTHQGLTIMDITNYFSPKIVSKTTLIFQYGIPLHIEIKDTIALVTTDVFFELVSIDIKDVNNPIVLDNLFLESYLPLTYDLAVKGNYVYVLGDNSSKIFIVDISRPDSIHLVGSVNLLSGGLYLQVKGNNLYVGGGGGLQIYDITTPQIPNQVGVLNIGIVGDLTIDSNYLYVEVVDSGGIIIMNDSIPSNPTVVGKVNSLVSTWYGKIIAHSKLLFIAASVMFTIVDLNNIDSPFVSWRMVTGQGGGKIFVKDSLAFTASSVGFSIVSISNPSIPRYVSSIFSGGIACDIISDGSYAYLLNTGNVPGSYGDARGLWIIDISNPSIPSIINHHTGIVKGSDGGHPSITKSGDLIFIAQPHVTQNDTSLEIIDVSNPYAPTTIGVLSTSYQARDVTVKDSIVFLATENGGLRLINIKNPEFPYEIYSMFNEALCLALDSNYLYVSSDSLFILDITNAASPLILSSIYTGVYYDEISVSRNFAYCLLQDNAQVDVIDVANPTKPVKLGEFSSRSLWGIDDVAAIDDIVLVGENWHNIWVLQNKLASRNQPQVQISEGWNLLSLPTGSMEINLKDDIFPASSSSAFTYTSGYVTRNTIENGVGYWLKYDSSQTNTFYGFPLPEFTIHAKEGWNMIGSIGNSISISSISASPEGIITSNFYGYDNSYFIADTIYPGKGYWIKVSQDGQLLLSNSGTILNSNQTIFSKEILNNFNQLIIRDNVGNSQKLYFGEKTNAISEQLFEIPPSAPGNDFDVRFANGNMVAMFEGGKTQEFSINISSPNYPITIEWEVLENKVATFLRIGTKGISITGNNYTQILSPESSIVLTVKDIQSIPDRYSLEQNYPNPFNPRTVIKYTIPDDIHVELKIYDILGREVATLVNEMQEAGYKSVELDASALGGLPSGLYLYRFKAGKFISIKKMLLIQ